MTHERVGCVKREWLDEAVCDMNREKVCERERERKREAVWRHEHRGSVRERERERETPKAVWRHE